MTNSSDYYSEREFIRMSTCQVGINSRKQNYKEACHSNLYISDISKYDYGHAQIVWKEFKLKNLGEYHDFYLKTDVLLLSNVFETFRNNCLEYYKLDPAHFYTSPGLAWQACLKKTGVRLELLTDPDMLLMFEKGIRGGITQAVHQQVHG